MAVVRVREGEDDEEFSFLAVPIKFCVWNVYSFKYGLEEKLKHRIYNDACYSVLTFEGEVIDDVDYYLVEEICDFMPGECGDKADDCPHRWKCFPIRINVDDIEWVDEDKGEGGCYEPIEG